ncbi:MAG: DNA mismatch repair protein MutS [Tannerella sp.]|jgi:hypothetical protein|nr:DNA mismatch repair protein MutS [Tannerella sp.]
MEPLFLFYQAQITFFTAKREALKKAIHRLGTVRLLLFVAAIATIWFCRDYDRMILIGILFVFAVPFGIFMVYHTKLSDRKDFADANLQMDTNELKGLDYDFSAFDGAAEAADSHHSFVLDLDIFGDQSLFQSINRTVTRQGRACLIDWFTKPLDTKQQILDRQQAVKELAEKEHFRRCFFVNGKIGEDHDDKTERLHALTTSRTYFARSVIRKIWIWIVPLLWTGVTAGFFAGVVPFGFLWVMLAFAFLIANIDLPRIHPFLQSVEKIEKVLLTYSRLVEMIELEQFNSILLQQYQNMVITKGKRVSGIIRHLSKIIGALDQRFSLAGILLNLLYMRDIRHVMQLEQWVETYAKEFDQWFRAIACMDAMCSLGCFAFNHPDYTYPEISGNYFEMKGKAMGHPLVHRDLCVRNDLWIEKNPYFLVITGANMAGKSTYLRTAGVNFLLACLGLPVCAESLTVYPAHLVTSLRTADSLTANESYFFAELKRLKMIIDRLNEGEKLFVILDEILKGTNSDDKQKGSLALMKQLIAKNTCGIIATHDILLGSLAQDFPGEIKNYRFEAAISGDNLTFSYRLLEGIAQNMNACFLMEKMGITL